MRALARCIILIGNPAKPGNHLVIYNCMAPRGE